jgi:divalent metal cation (Fe/Co/Zn/Cd) transporter
VSKAETERLTDAGAALCADASARDWTRIALALVLVTVAYNLVEAALALWSGFRAASVVLVGFGLDSMIECAAAGVLLWRLRLEWRGVDERALERAERRVHRFVGATFFALAAYVVGQAAWTLTVGAAPSESLLGIVLAVASLIVMPLVAWGKLRAAREIRSDALRAEAKETLACSYLSLTLLLGLGANAVWGWWWADPIAALAMVPWLVQEGREGIRGESCQDGGGSG